jgi:hypothetical protein
MANQQQDGGGGTAAIAAMIMIALLIGVYFAMRAGKKGGGGGGEDEGAAGPVTGGGLSQTQTQFVPTGANVNLNLNTPYTNNWAAVIDAVGSIFLDQLKDKLEDKLKSDEDGKAKVADAEARANADAAKAAADAEAARAAADADKARADADKAQADAAKAQADADKARAAADKAQADAARAQVEAEKARAEGKANDAANKQVTDLDTAQKAQADADAARAAADKAQADAAKAAADADAARASADKAAADAVAAEKAKADADLRATAAAETVKAMEAEEEYARAVEDDISRKGDTRTGRSIVPEVRSAMVEKVRGIEADVRNGANAKALNDDFIDTARVEVDKTRASAEIETRTKTIANAAQMDTDIARAETDARLKAQADADAKAQTDVRSETRRALDVETKTAAEAKVRTKANATAELGRPPKASPLEMEAKSRARGTIGSAETTRVVEMGEPNRDSKTGLMEPETEDPEGRLRSHPLEYNGPRSSSWGKMPSEMMKRSNKYIRKVGSKLQRSMAKNPTTKIEADVKAMIDSKVMARSSGKAAAKQAGMAAVSMISKIDLASDLMMVVQVFCDAFFYGAFPDESTLITPETVKGIQEKSVKAQIDSTTDYNKDVVDSINAGMSDYKYARAQWPVIIGPLDEPSKHTLKNPVTVSPRYPEYENQQRVQAEVDAVREKLLRTTYKNYWISIFGEDAYDEIVADPTDSLVNYVENTDFEITKSDDLYREAFTSVCLYHGGVVYEDVRPAADPNWGGRPRFQCSWANIDLCETSANTWVDTNGRNGGNYGEWYTFDELNVALSNITEAPPSGKGIVGCHGTDTSTYRKACGIETGHPLRKNGKTGACIISSPAVPSICRSNKGTYVSAEHKCVFSEEYCQSIGTCFDRREKMCYLPGEAMFAVSMVFGTGGPREWIKVNGCNFASTPEDGFYDIISLTPLGLFTARGQTFIADMLANHEHWNEGMKQTLGNPVMIAVVSSMAVVFGMGTKAGTKLLSKVVKEGKGKQTAVGLLVMAVAIGVAIGAMTLQSQEEQNKGPPDPTYGPYASEYTVGGWKDNIGTSPPLTLGFNDGWVTKPIKVHADTPWPQVLSPSKLLPTPVYVTSGVQGIPTCDKTPRRFYSSYNLDGAWQSGFSMSLAVKTYTQTHTPPVAKNLCYTDNKIRAGARATDNELFCMDPFPPATYTDNVNIGELAPDSTTDDTSRSYMTSRTWTDGVDPTTPQYPFDAVNGNNPSLWYYQLVYDKHNMVGMSPVTEDGVTYKKGYPTALWNTELLQFYFLDSTIQEMRQYYCIQGLIDAPDGSWDATTGVGVHPKCWGYLNVAVPGYKYTPMTVPVLSETSTTAQTVLATAAPTDALPSSDPLTIARSITSPQMILVYNNYYSGVTVADYIAIVSLNPRAWVIGDTLTTDSAVSLGFDPAKGPVKIIGTTSGLTALIAREQTRTAGSPGRVAYTITRTSSPDTSSWTNQSLINWIRSLGALLA